MCDTCGCNVTPAADEHDLDGQRDRLGFERNGADKTQLPLDTGDADFASPEALVAFALGMTLFVITLGLNVLALYIVRKYREQYE